MEKKEVIELFFSRTLEKMYDEYILDDKDYVVPKGALDHYINTILSVPYSEFINYIKENLHSLKINSKNITQCSNFPWLFTMRRPVGVPGGKIYKNMRGP